jgi:hypothetical protein
MCKEMGVLLLGRLPLDPALAAAAEAGKPVFGSLPGAAAAGGVGRGASPPRGQSDVGHSPAVCLPHLRKVVNALLQQLTSQK